MRLFSPSHVQVPFKYYSFCTGLSGSMLVHRWIVDGSNPLVFYFIQFGLFGDGAPNLVWKGCRQSETALPYARL